MNTQQGVHPKPSANGFGRRRGEREGGSRVENKSQSGKANHSKFTNAGSKSGNYESPSRDRLVYLTTGLIGQHVEVQVKNGTIYSGIFHATNAEKDFGIILKMARMIKDGSLRGQKSMAESVSKAPSKTLIIPSKEFVQVIAKDVSISRDGLLNEVQHEKQQDIMLDSVISQSRRGEMERELEPWVPDEDDPRCPELENIFDGHWNRNWDQFETNETLFGVKSTFDEDLYTTKLEKGPRMRELEREALRIAREIEGEETHDMHAAEERGSHLLEIVDIDEETRFSAVYRGEVVDDSGYDEDEDILLDTHNTETFGDSSGSVSKSSIDWASGKSNNGTQGPSSSSSLDYTQGSESSVAPDLCRPGSYDHARQLASEPPFKSFPSTAGESSEHGGIDNATESVEKQMLAEGIQTSKLGDSLPSINGTKDGFDKGGLSSNATSYAPSQASPKGHEKSSSSDLLEGQVTGKAHVSSHGRPGSSASSNSERAAASGGPGLSPSSSLGSLSSERSTLNPHAKEFKLNPNAKSFVPSQAPVRPPSPVSDGSFYYPSNVPAVPHIPGMPVGIGVGPSFAHQPVMFSPQPMQAPQSYFHPNGPQYGQQMLLGHPRQVVYMPGYQPEMPYKGRDY